MGRLALEQFPAPNLAHKLSGAGGDFPADSDDVGPALNFDALERIVIEVHLVRFRQNLCGMIRVPNPS